MVGGFLLNNQLTDFSFEPSLNGLPVANAVEPRKAPRSSMSPMIVLNQDGSLELVIGSPGGSAIIGYVARATIGILDWGLGVQQAIDVGNATAREAPARIEAPRMPAGVLRADNAAGRCRKARWKPAAACDPRDACRLEGGADSRRAMGLWDACRWRSAPGGDRAVSAAPNFAIVTRLQQFDIRIQNAQPQNFIVRCRPITTHCRRDSDHLRRPCSETRGCTTNARRKPAPSTSKCCGLPRQSRRLEVETTQLRPVRSLHEYKALLSDCARASSVGP